MIDNLASAHGCVAVIGTAGVLIRGPSASGKSRLTDVLVEEAHKAGVFAHWVADDRVFLRNSNDRLIATAPIETAGLIEHHSLGIKCTNHLQSANVDLVVDLVVEDHIERLPEKTETVVAEIPLPILFVPQKQLVISVPLVFAALSKLDDEGYQTRE